MEFNSILVATDFSECSGVAFSAAQTLAQRFDARLILLHVISQNFLDKLSSHLGKTKEEVSKDLRHKAEKEMAAFMKQWKSGETEVDTIIATGTPFQEVAILARDLAVDLVVMGGFGRRGRSEIEEVFFGSTAEKVVRLLPCPVLCIPK
ncbi:MAG TPA: universal stress protein [Desulfobacterales bacterium]|nr:universal stress protein [Desulfobacterales bacterium]